MGEIAYYSIISLILFIIGGPLFMYVINLFGANPEPLAVVWVVTLLVTVMYLSGGVEL